MILPMTSNPRTVQHVWEEMPWHKSTIRIQSNKKQGIKRCLQSPFSLFLRERSSFSSLFSVFPHICYAPSTIARFHIKRNKLENTIAILWWPNCSSLDGILHIHWQVLETIKLLGNSDNPFNTRGWYLKSIENERKNNLESTPGEFTINSNPNTITDTIKVHWLKCVPSSIISIDSFCLLHASKYTIIGKIEMNNCLEWRILSCLHQPYGN